MRRGREGPRRGWAPAQVPEPAGRANWDAGSSSPLGESTSTPAGGAGKGGEGKGTLGAGGVTPVLVFLSFFSTWLGLAWPSSASGTCLCPLCLVIRLEVWAGQFDRLGASDGFF